jgi:cytochrome P450
MDTCAEELARDFDHYSPSQAADPYPVYETLRSQCPVAHAEAHGGFFTAANYDDVKAVVSTYGAFSSLGGTGVPKLGFPLLPIDLDPPEQTRFRKLLNPMFTVEAVSTLRPKIQGLADDLIDGFIERGSAELAGELFRPLLSGMVIPMLGIPLADTQHIAALVDFMVRERAKDPEGVAKKTAELAGYLSALIEAHRRHPDPKTVTTRLVQAADQGFVLSNEQIVSTQILVLFGGLDTTSAVMAEAIRYLADHPDETAALRAGWLAWPRAIEEWIRWTSPVQGQARTVTADTSLSGVPLAKGDRVFALYGSANRDLRRFEDADRCVLDRDISEHLAFGAGAHICLGRNLARLELEITLRTVADRLQGLQIAKEFVPDYAVGESRGLKSLLVSFKPGPVRRPG